VFTTAASPGTSSSLSSVTPCALLSCASRGATPGKPIQSRSTRGSGGSPGVSSGGSQTSNQTASNPPAIFRGRVEMDRVTVKEDQGIRRTRTAGDATTDDARHRYARIEQFGLLLRLDFNAGEPSHLAHFTTNLLHASEKIQLSTTRRLGKAALGNTSVSR
jgi:hypothetical protein